MQSKSVQKVVLVVACAKASPPFGAQIGTNLV